MGNGGALRGGAGGFLSWATITTLTVRGIYFMTGVECSVSATGWSKVLVNKQSSTREMNAWLLPKNQRYFVGGKQLDSPKDEKYYSSNLLAPI